MPRTDFLGSFLPEEVLESELARRTEWLGSMAAPAPAVKESAIRGWWRHSSKLLAVLGAAGAGVLVGAVSAAALTGGDNRFFVNQHSSTIASPSAPAHPAGATVAPSDEKAAPDAQKSTPPAAPTAPAVQQRSSGSPRPGSKDPSEKEKSDSNNSHVETDAKSSSSGLTSARQSADT
jgi:hypothetical protein